METPPFFQETHCSQSHDKPPNNAPPADHFIVEDLLDFSNEDVVDVETSSFHASTDDSSTVDISIPSAVEPNKTNADASYARSFTDVSNFSSDLCVPYEDLAELEWVSTFVDESFSSEDEQKLQLITGVKTRPYKSVESRVFQPEPNRSGVTINTNTKVHTDVSPVPGKARSKRSRAAPCNWTSRLLLLSPTTSSEPHIVVPDEKKTSTRKKESRDGNGEGRKCLHCATDKTPQWRTGPLGPKTLCNACGVRYKSGRLVPEYRPAASPTFMLTKHSNSHRKVLELRRQKEAVRSNSEQQHDNMVLDASNGDDYLIHQHVGPHFMQLI